MPDLIKKCKKNGMYAMALTDHGNMFGIKELVDTVKKENGKVKDQIGELESEKEKLEKGEIEGEEPLDEEAKAARLAELDSKIIDLKSQIFKPIIGIEAYCAHRTLYDKDANVKERDPETGRERITDRGGWHLILLAKNKQGYLNLCKLSSIAFTDGYFYNPRIDHNVLEQYHEGLVCCSACIGGEIPQKIMKGDIEEAEEAVRWFKNLFGDDFYLEMQRHKTDKPNAAYDTYPRHASMTSNS